MLFIENRIEQVSMLLRQGLTQTEIAEKLGVSRQTIVRDVSHLKILSMSWLDDMAKNGFVFECKKVSEQVDDSFRELKKLYDKTDDVWQKISILRDMDRNRKLYLEMLSEYPTLHAYRKAIKLKSQHASQAEA